MFLLKFVEKYCRLKSEKKVNVIAATIIKYA